jgi:SpoVK/Ycf46/Vps4 family AAA+-type ATPase
MSVPAYLKKIHAPQPQTYLADAVGLYRPLLGTWLLEMALMFDWYSGNRRSRYDRPDILEDDDFCSLTGLAVFIDDEDDNEQAPRRRKRGDPEDDRHPTPARCKELLKKQLAVLRKEEMAPTLPLFHNISLLSTMITLSEADQALLAFTAVITLFPPFRNTISMRNFRVSHQILCQMLSRLTGLPEQDFRTAIGENGLLMTTGVVKVRRNVCDLEDKLELMEGLAGILLTSHASGEELTSRFLKRAVTPTLKLENFPHLASDTEILRSYLKNALEGKTVGVNILLHGKPGVGKTEYVQALAAELGVDLFEIDFADEDGDPIKGEGRLRAYSLCQNLLARTTNAMLLFDEIEDVFPDGSAFMRMLFGAKEVGGETVGKAWINRTMERNPVPALWVSNHITQIDPAYLRRFDYSIQFTTPPKAVRLTIARHHLGCFNPPTGWLEQLAANEELTPGQLDRAAKVARIAGISDQSRVIKLVDQTLDRSASLLSQKHAPARAIVSTGYSLEYLNTDNDIPAVLAGLRRRAKGTFCFYGSPGTGKSELARYLADEIGKPALLKRASDLIDCYVGETEKNIAALFTEARQQDAVLILDEADSFLADRQYAQRSWEVTQVNELLTQMEAFEGIFICTTNLMDKLDSASLRRFAFKIRFDSLTSEQRWSMFREELLRLGGYEAGLESWEQRVRSLERLTPGDFAVAVRQFELWDVPATPEKLFVTLQKECEAKGMVTRAIGF